MAENERESGVDGKELSSEEIRGRLDQFFRFAQVGRCVNGVTHDINNHLGAILAYAELASMDEAVSAETQRMLKEITSGVDKCSELISRLTDIARDEKPTSAMVDPGTLVQRALLIRGYALRTAQVKVESNVQENLPPIVADVPKLVMALIHLLVNAQEAVAGAQHKLLRIRVSAVENHIRFLVWNSGPAIAEELREAVFTPYVTDKEGIHLGLGLASARRYAEIHGGTLVYLPDQGFELRIPRDQA